MVYVQNTFSLPLMPCTEAKAKHLLEEQKAVILNYTPFTILKGGVRKLNQCPRKVYGFGLFDKVMYNGELCYIHARRTRGYFNVRRLDGTVIADGVQYRKLTLVERARNIDIFSSHRASPGVPADKEFNKGNY